MSKLTLSVDNSVVQRAKRYARTRGVSVSELVENYLDLVSRRVEGQDADTPVLRSIRGILKKADPEDYKRHLLRKYR